MNIVTGKVSVAVVQEERYVGAETLTEMIVISRSSSAIDFSRWIKF